MQYVKIHTSIRDNVKYAALPSPEAKLAFIYTLLVAKDSDPEGQWPDRGYLEAQLRRGDEWAVAHLDTIIATGLLATDDDGRVYVPQWRHWQGSAASRSAAQLETEAPKVLAKRRASTAHRQRIHYWTERGLAHIQECPEEIREAVIARLVEREAKAKTSRKNLTQPNAYREREIDISLSTVPNVDETTESAPDRSPDSSADASNDDDAIATATPSDASGKCPVHGRVWQDRGRGKFCPARADAGEAADAKGYCALRPTSERRRRDDGGAAVGACRYCGRRVKTLAGATMLTHRESRQSYPVHGECVEDAVEAGCFEGHDAVDYDEAGFRIVEGSSPALALDELPF